LLEVAELAATHCGEAHPARLSLLAQIANNEAGEEEPDHAVRISCAQKLFTAFEAQKDYAQAGQALLGLAFAQGDAGDIPAAAKSYERARIAGERMGDFAQASSAERNHGLMLSSLDRESPEAEARLRNAVTLATRAGDVESRGKAEGCLGVYYQHIDRLPEAEPLLKAAVAHMPASTSDAVVIRAHLTALQNGVSCGCDDMEGAFQESYCAAIREQVEREMPGLLENISFAPDESGKWSVQVRIAREPSPSELERLHIVVTQAEAAFRQGVTERH
jgi:tetratricopeptide (TPR) repeat protein